MMGGKHEGKIIGGEWSHSDCCKGKIVVHNNTLVCMVCGERCCLKLDAPSKVMSVVADFEKMVRQRC
ncbi:hypothetical protein ACFL96_14030 [Thermoproteota archaeon]